MREWTKDKTKRKDPKLSANSRDTAALAQLYFINVCGCCAATSRTP